MGNTGANDKSQHDGRRAVPPEPKTAVETRDPRQQFRQISGLSIRKVEVHEINPLRGLRVRTYIKLHNVYVDNALNGMGPKRAL